MSKKLSIIPNDEKEPNSTQSFSFVIKHTNPLIKKTYFELSCSYAIPPVSIASNSTARMIQVQQKGFVLAYHTDNASLLTSFQEALQETKNALVGEHINITRPVSPELVDQLGIQGQIYIALNLMQEELFFLLYRTFHAFYLSSQSGDFSFQWSIDLFKDLFVEIQRISPHHASLPTFQDGVLSQQEQDHYFGCSSMAMMSALEKITLDDGTKTKRAKKHSVPMDTGEDEEPALKRQKEPLTLSSASTSSAASRVTSSTLFQDEEYGKKPAPPSPK